MCGLLFSHIVEGQHQIQARDICPQALRKTRQSAFIRCLAFTSLIITCLRLVFEQNASVGHIQLTGNLRLCIQGTENIKRCDAMCKQETHQEMR